VLYILRDALGEYRQIYPGEVFRREPLANRFWDLVCGKVAEEMGLETLGSPTENTQKQCHSYLLDSEAGDALRFIELSFQFVDEIPRKIPDFEREQAGLLHPDAAIERLNQRLRQHNVPYKFVGGRMISAESDYLAAEVTTPAINLLHDVGFRGANDEFMQAQKDYRSGDYRGAIVKANAAFESTMKAICDLRRWHYPANATATDLIGIILAKDLIPKYLESELHSLRSVLASGLPTVRNRSGGHGQGREVVAVPRHVAVFALNTAASNIVLLVDAHKALR
jgi:HEPN domain-containing protein